MSYTNVVAEMDEQVAVDVDYTTVPTVEIQPPEATPPQAKERFRISKLPTGEELQAITAEIDGIEAGCIAGEGDGGGGSGGGDSPPPPYQEDGDSVKHVQLTLPPGHSIHGMNGRTYSSVSHSQVTTGYTTHDAVPLSVFYKNAENAENAAIQDQRPTLDQLHKGENLDNAKMRHWDPSKTVALESDGSLERSQSSSNLKTATKLGWIKGVLVPTLLNIWGVILFLRMPWIVGQAGIGLASVIVLLATFVTVVTTLSMSAVCTNGEIRGGGAYYLISRSLGPEFGGSIGVIFSIANAVAVSLYLVGFAETVQALMSEHGAEMLDKMNDIRIIGLLALVLIFLVTMIGLEWVMATQSFLLFLLVAAIITVVAGTVYPSPTESRTKMAAEGLPGYTWTNFKTNFPPFNGTSDVRKGFFDVFSIFFPAATGIMAGSNLSGDLKDPSFAVPLGTLLAIGISSSFYIILIWLLGSSTMRGAGMVVSTAAYGIMDAVNSTTATPNNNSTMIPCTIMGEDSTDPLRCLFGSIPDKQIMAKISVWAPLITAGIFAATLSSALASLVSAPKIFQAVCKDKIFPGIDIFGKEYGRNGEPRNGYLLTLVIAAGFTAIAKLDVIAPIISNFFLMAYALVNYSVFQSSLSKSPGWRPSFKYYNKWISLLGFLLCIAIMFLINWWAALITLAVIVTLYKYVDIRKPDINWGSSGHAHNYLKALRYTRRLDAQDEHVKTYRVQCLALTGQPSLRPNLVHFASHLTKHFGLLVVGEVTITDRLQAPTGHEGKWLAKHKIKAFHQIIQSETLQSGVRCMLQSAGLGKLKPNMLLVGYMNRWQDADVGKVEEYYNVINDAFSLRYGVGILRLQDGFDITDESFEQEDDIEDGMVENHEPDWYTEDWDEQHKENSNEASDESERKSDESNPRDPKESPEALKDIVLTFDKKKKGFIDVWWLYDDGGLTMLLPHLLSLSSHWRGSKLRIFTPASDKKIKANQIRMANLLKKFRIDFSSVVEFRGINKHPNEESIKAFKRLRKGEHVPQDGTLDKKTLRQIRLGELLHEHSKEAKIIVLTLPVPKQSYVGSLMYMSWLEVLSMDLPPVLMVRGNQTSVLTFYS